MRWDVLVWEEGWVVMALLLLLGLFGFVFFNDINITRTGSSLSFINIALISNIIFWWDDDML